MKEKIFIKCTAAYLLEANVAPLSMKHTSCIIIVVYPHGEMQNLEVIKRAVWTSFFTSNQQIKLQYGLYTNDDDN